jgi:GNAT superfamily N-acetyltransferase
MKKQPMNIGYHIIVYKPESVGVTFYLTEDTSHYGEDIKKNIENSVANIQTHIDREDGDLTIKWLGVNEEMRGKKLGQFLITMALLYTTNFDENITLARLDDDSDNYANGIEDPTERRYAQRKNIYCKIGFVYEDDTGGPEMEGDVHEMMKKNIKTFVKISSRSSSSSSSSRTRTVKKKR